MKNIIFFCICLATVFSLELNEHAQGSLMVVDVSKASKATRLSVFACAGLFNRDETIAGPAYTFKENYWDPMWLKDIDGISNPTLTSIPDFLTKCFKTVAKGYIRYNYTTQQITIPNLVTVAGVLDAIPLEDGSAWTSYPLVFDAVKLWDGFDNLDATSYVYDHYLNQTTGMAKTNPGLDVHKDPINPPLSLEPDLALTDFLVKEKIFTFFLNDGCIPLTKEHAMMDKIAKYNPWPKPTVVYGYDDTFPVAGDLFEAETTCIDSHNLGQCASAGVTNLGYFSRKPAISTPLQQNPAPTGTYNSSKTYISFVIGDGDNVAYMKTEHKKWWNIRLAACAADSSPRGCPPILWSTSPQLLHLAPDIIRWYYDQALITKNDFFVLPPSGDLYAYPSLLSDADQAQFVEFTERDAYLMNTSGSTSWEMFYSWASAEKNYFPRYSENDIVRGFYLVNVPFDLPTLIFGPNQFYKIKNGKTVMFRPRSWRGTDSSSIPFSGKEYITPENFAKEINGYPKGTVTAIYVTSDGGAGIEVIFDLVKLLDEHVEVVNHNQISAMALQRG